jgi:6-phosphofructokinase 1
MEKKMKKIGVLTSGGDGPGMNAGIRSVVRSALHYNLEVAGIIRGYQGLVDDEIISMNHRSVANIIDRGGTILKTARSKDFQTPEGMKKAVETLRKHQIDGLVLIGGDGTYRGGQALTDQFHFPVVGMPGTIDNDLCGTDQTIGCGTAVATALDAIDKVRDTAHSMERIFVIEVMGNKSGYIAMEVALGSGAEDLIIPERKFDYDEMCHRIQEGNKKGKISWMIVVAEGAAKAVDVASTVHTLTGLQTRYVVLGHVQRGGSPTGSDRTLATRLGVKAVELLLEGNFGKAIGLIENKINLVDLKTACNPVERPIEEYYRLIRMLT